MNELIGKILGGRYEIIEKIGTGGMAEVYRARCHLLKRDVAIKVLRSEFASSDEFRQRFKREAQAVAALSHHNIVNIYDVGQDDGLHYIVMEYIDGQTLKEVIKQEGPLPYTRAVNIAIQICAALEHAHKHGIIHRDIKPQNILLTDGGIVKVTDFGIAKAVAEASATLNESNTMGSVHYISPEQARGGYVDAKSDIYSLGIVLYEMVTGQVPFTGDTAVAVALKHLHDDIKPLRELNPSIPYGLEQVIMKATQKDRDRRYDSASSMMLDLKRVLREPYGHFVSISDMADEVTKTIPLMRQTSNDDGAKKKKKTTGRRLWKILLICVIILVIMAAGVATAMNLYKDYFVVPEISVPSLVGKHESDARQELLEKGLTLNVSRREYSNDVAEGFIISQEPEAGTMLKEGNAVNVVVSLGAKSIKVPNIVNKTETDARLILEQAGMESGNVEHRYSDRYPAGYVMEQNPKADIWVTSENTKVDYVVSDGPQVKKVILPDLTNQLLSDAQKVLESYNLKLGQINREDSQYAKDVVIRQKPDPKTSVEEGSAVDLWVSTGNPKIYSPKQVTIILPQSIPDPNNPTVPAKEMDVKVIKKEGDTTQIIYQGKCKPEDKKITLMVEGKTKATIEVYIFDKLYSVGEVDFTKEAQ